jgi:hypothetical protein
MWLDQTLVMPVMICAHPSSYSAAASLCRINDEACIDTDRVVEGNKQCLGYRHHLTNGTDSRCSCRTPPISCICRTFATVAVCLYIPACRMNLYYQLHQSSPFEGSSQPGFHAVEQRAQITQLQATNLYARWDVEFSLTGNLPVPAC